MNNLTAHINFKIALDKNSNGVAYGGSPAFLPEEEDVFLNQAQNEIISNKIDGLNQLRVGFEQTASRISELDALVRTDNSIEAVNSKYNEFIIDDVHDNSNRMTILSLMLNMGNSQMDCILLNHEDVRLYRQTYNNTPWIDVPVFIIENNKAYLYVDPLWITDDQYKPVGDKYTLSITYLKRPKQFDYMSPDEELDLPDDVMQEIINRAALIALENIESKRITSKAQINTLGE